MFAVASNVWGSNAFAAVKIVWASGGGCRQCSGQSEWGGMNGWIETEKGAGDWLMAGDEG
ncbi:hypothetical protein TALK_05905 [Thalassospira alkalitolerans]|uniref:Uncharacterized protein n=1 Tax=Thalassospira alkalitolerans TaxID=1293890 RepID=A0A1Y2LDY8_9PROT|nr:hypothetical protein TALK_05905 [Thalassospira alkalitolerans]